MSDFAVEMKHISKSFLGHPILSDVSFQLSKGEIGLLIGKEGSGKTALISILLGFYRADSGSLSEFGKEIEANSIKDRKGYAIGIVNGISSFSNSLTVIQNIILGNEPVDFLGFIHYRKAIEEVTGLQARYGLDIDLKEKIGRLSREDKLKAGVLKLLYAHKSIFVFDEPFRNIDEPNRKELSVIIRNLVKEGNSVIIISSKIDESFDIADRITVLRKGECVGAKLTKDVTAKEIEDLMEEPIREGVKNQNPVGKDIPSGTPSIQTDSYGYKEKISDGKNIRKKSGFLKLFKDNRIISKHRRIRKSILRQKDGTIYSRAIYSSDSRMPRERYFSCGLSDTKGDGKIYIISPLLKSGIININAAEQKPVKPEEEKVSPKKSGRPASFSEKDNRIEPRNESIRKTSRRGFIDNHGIKKKSFLPDGNKKKLTKEELYILRINNLRPYWKKKREK